jgi:hypothetical protein
VGDISTCYVSYVNTAYSYLYGLDSCCSLYVLWADLMNIIMSRMAEMGSNFLTI